MHKGMNGVKFSLYAQRQYLPFYAKVYMTETDSLLPRHKELAGFVPPRRRRPYWVRKVRAKGAILVPVRAILVSAWRFLNKAFRKTAGAVVTISITVQPTLPVSSLIACTLLLSSKVYYLFMDCMCYFPSAWSVPMAKYPFTCHGVLVRPCSAP